MRIPAEAHPWLDKPSICGLQSLGTRLAAAARLGADVKKILLVEDDDELAALTMFLLLRAGLGVVHAKDGKAALRLLEDSHFDLIVTDIMMPRLSGADLCRAIRRQNRLRTIPVVALTSLPESLVRSIGAPFDAHIQKPFVGDQLLAQVHDLLMSEPADRRV